MTLSPTDFAAIGLYFLILLVFGIAVRRVRDFEDYSVGRRQIPASMIFASICGTYIGPGFSVGLVGKGFSSGYLFYFLPLFFVIQTLIVARWLAPRLHGFSTCYTVGDVIGERYGKISHILAGIVSVGLCIGFSAVMAKVGGVILSQTTGLSLFWSIVIVTWVGVLYTFTGGLKSVIATDAFQFSIFAVAIPAVVFFCVQQDAFSFARAQNAAAELTSAAYSSLTPVQLVGLAVSFLLGEALIPPYTNRALASRSAEVASRGFFWAGLYGIVWIGICVGLGIVGATLLPATTGSDDVFMKLVVSYVPQGLIGFVLIALVAIVMSSQESVLNAGAVAFTRDITPAFRPISQKQSLVFSRWYTIIVGVLATGFAIYAPTIIDALLILYSIWAPSILVPLIAALFVKRTRAASGWLSILVGGGASLFWRFALGEPFGFPSILVGLTGALVGYLMGYVGGTVYVNKPMESDATQVGRR